MPGCYFRCSAIQPFAALLLLTALSLITFVPRSAAEDNDWKAIVLITARFKTPAGEVPYHGTGFFADHDGLIVTVDHLLVHYHGPVVDSFTRPAGEALHTIKSDVTVYSPYLRRPFPVLSIVLGDQLRAGKWADMALIRVEVPPDVRSRVRVLELSHNSVSTGDEVHTYQPNCWEASNPRCLQLGISTGKIKNTDPTSFAQSFESEAIKPLSCSGGPVLDAAGRVVGLCSIGTPLPGGDISYSQSNIPGIYLHLYSLGSLPPSLFFQDPIKYKAAVEWELPTSIDVYELFRPESAISPDVDEKSLCGCLCKVLSRNPYALVMWPEFYMKRRNCLPPDCAAELAQSAEEYLTRPPAKHIDAGEFSRGWYALAKTLLGDSEEIKFGTPYKRKGFFRSLGYVFSGVATKEIQLPPGTAEPKEVVDDGLKAFGKSLEVETSYLFQKPIWTAMATLLELRGDVSTAQKARTVGERYSLDFESETQNTVETAQRVRDRAEQQIDWANADIKESQSQIGVIDILLRENSATLNTEDLRRRKKSFESRIQRDKAAVAEETKKRDDAQTFLDDTEKLEQEVLKVASTSGSHPQLR